MMTDKEEEEATNIIESLCRTIKFQKNIFAREFNDYTEIVFSSESGEWELIIRPQKLTEKILREYEQSITEEYKGQEGEEWSDLNLYKDITNATSEKLEFLLTNLPKNLKLTETVDSALQATLRNFEKLVEQAHKPHLDADKCLKFYEKVIELQPLWKRVNNLIKKDYSLEEIKDKSAYKELLTKAIIKEAQLEEIVSNALKGRKRSNNKREYSPQGIAFEHARQELNLGCLSYEKWKKMYQSGKKHFDDLFKLGLR